MGAAGEEVLIGGALLLAIVLIGFGALIVRTAADNDRKSQRREELESIVRGRLFDQLDRSDPDWSSWVSGLSEDEREVAVGILDEYLRRVEGERKAQFVEASKVLNVEENALRTLRTGDTREKLSALTWLVLLDSRPDVATLRRQCSGTPDLRAAAARVLYESDHDDRRAIGTEFLLRDGEALSVFGRDTLYRPASTGTIRQRFSNGGAASIATGAPP